MGSLYFYLPSSALLVSVYWGRTEISDSMSMRAARAADPLRKQARAHVIDLSQLEGTTASPQSESAMFRALGESYVATYGKLPTVIIAARPHMFGQARVFETVATVGSEDMQIGVVRTWAAAAEYLGLDLTEAEAEAGRRREAAEQG
ncbi:MAG TPA: hypothetical protein VFU23_02075 [Gemmatimonadales bacterium]|nr:hypothetical protein [Gemmatimonadales bacterium]